MSRRRAVGSRLVHLSKALAYRGWRFARKGVLATRHLAGFAAWVTRAAVTPRARSTPAGNRVLMLTISDIAVDPRPNKVARSLADDGYEVDIMAIALDGDVGETEVTPDVRYVRVKPESPFQLFLFFQREFVRPALDRNFAYVHANDLTTLTVGWVLARLKGVPLIYDAHELWTENVAPRRGDWVPMSRGIRAVAGLWERLLLRSVDLLVTVGPSIVAEYERKKALKRPPLLLPNYPALSLLDARPTAASIREACGLGGSHFVTLYMGGVNPLRNIDSVIRAHRYLPDDHVFVVMGPGVEMFREDYEAIARDEGVDDRVFFLPAVQMHEVVAAAADADCGIVMLRNICKNFYFFYPNKLFEYAAAGLPVAVSAFPDVSRFVQAEDCGVTFDPDSPESIAAALRSLSSDRTAAREKGRRGRQSIETRYNWGTAVADLVAAYRTL